MKSRRYQLVSNATNLQTPLPRFCSVSVEPASASGELLLRQAEGNTATQLSGGRVFGPFSASVAQQHYAQLCSELEARGYRRASESAIFQQLSAPNRSLRARAAVALGWRQPEGAAVALRAAALQATTESSSIIDALGRLGDAASVELACAAADKKLLSRRRSGVEALRNLACVTGLAQARTLGLERLPETLRAVLLAQDETSLSGVPAVIAALTPLAPAARGLALDQLYEFATPLCVAVVHALLPGTAGSATRAPMWRYTKSIFKRAMLRGDAATFALASLTIERDDRPKIRRVEIKSGLDGQTRQSTIFTDAVRAYLLRAAWRHLRRVGFWQPERYPEFAAAVLTRYRLSDARTPRVGGSPFGHCWLLYRLLYPATALTLSHWRARVRGPVACASWHALPFHAQWQLRPNLRMALLAYTELPALRALSLAAVHAEPTLWHAADAAQLSALLAAAEPEVRRLAGVEVSRRFDAKHPDMLLLCELLDAAAASTRALALGLLADSANVWAAQVDSVQTLLLRATGEGRSAATQAVCAALAAQPATQREALWTQLLQAIVHTTRAVGAVDGPMPDADALSAVVETITTFAAEFAARLPFASVAQLLQARHQAPRQIAGELLKFRPDTLAELGLPAVLVLAESELPSLRQAACALVGHAVLQLAHNPTPLLRLADARFPDTQRAAMALIEQLDFAQFGLDAVVNLCDSNQTPVQAFARRWVGKNLARLDTAALLEKLIEHPHRTMQGFAVELLDQHLPSGIASFTTVQAFLRLCLRRPRMLRTDKDRVIAFARARGLLDPYHAVLAIALFDDSLRTATKRDAEPLLVALTLIRLQFPELASDWRIAALAECA
jgi:hypothetical protein